MGAGDVEAASPPGSGCGPPCPCATSDIRVGELTERPIGASTRPDSALDRAEHEGPVGPGHLAGRQLGHQRRGRRPACGRRPSGPRCPGRAGARSPAGRVRTRPRRAGADSSGYRATSPWTSVPDRCPAPGWTTSPAGLSTTITSASSWTTVTSTDGSPTGPAGSSSSGRSTSRVWPSRSRRDRLVTTRPSTAHPAGGHQGVDRRTRHVGQQGHGPVHPHPVERGRHRHRAGRSRPPPVEHDREDQQDAAHGDARVGHVERREEVEVDEVDHRAVVARGRSGRTGCPAHRRG